MLLLTSLLVLIFPACARLPGQRLFHILFRNPPEFPTFFLCGPSCASIDGRGGGHALSGCTDRRGRPAAPAAVGPPPTRAPKGLRTPRFPLHCSLDEAVACSFRLLGWLFPQTLNTRTTHPHALPAMGHGFFPFLRMSPAPMSLCLPAPMAPLPPAPTCLATYSIHRSLPRSATILHMAPLLPQMQGRCTRDFFPLASRAPQPARRRGSPDGAPRRAAPAPALCAAPFAVAPNESRRMLRRVTSGPPPPCPRPGGPFADRVGSLYS